MKKKPSMLDMLKNFAKEVKDYAKEGAPNVSEEDYEERLGTCDGCEFLKRDVMRCGSCGCLVEHKAKWATSSCPEGFWKKQIIGQHGTTVTLSTSSKKKKERMDKIVENRKKRRGGSKGDTTKASD